ncbi:MAG: extracellular solute-binding protein [Anaerolineae bacterium]|nr:extracellular solute-binding protein [Anaerolineae bacterium]
MKITKLIVTLGVAVVLSMAFASCQPAPVAPAEEKPVAVAETKPAESEAAGATQPAAEEKQEVGTVTLWTQYNTDTPASARDKMFSEMLPKISEGVGGKIVNVNQPYDQLFAKANLAVQSGGEVPDVLEVHMISFPFLVSNGVLEDITEYVESSPAYADLSKDAIDSCRGSDGRIYCVPMSLATTTMYYYPELWPNGFPTSTEEMLKEAPRLKELGYFAMAGKVSEIFGGEYGLFPFVKSFGGSLAVDGKIAWASPETVKVVEFFREMYKNGYIPESMMSPGFDSQSIFQNGKAASFMAGTWSYAFLYPVVTPGGEKYDLGGESIIKAVADGKVAIAPMLTAPGGKSYSPYEGRGWGIMKGAKNVYGAKAFMEYIVQPEQNAEFCYAVGHIPIAQGAKEDPRYADTLYWQEIFAKIEPNTVKLDPIPNNVNQIMQKFADTVSTLILDQNLDIMTELEKAQNEANVLLEE